MEERPHRGLQRVQRALLVDAVRAARMETATGGRRGEIRRCADDSGHALERAGQRGERVDQPERVGVLRVGVQPRRGPFLDDLARVHDRDAVGVAIITRWRMPPESSCG